MKNHLILIAIFLSSFFGLRDTSAQEFTKKYFPYSSENKFNLSTNSSAEVYKNYNHTNRFTLSEYHSLNKLKSGSDSKNFAIVVYPLSLLLTKLSTDLQFGYGNGNFIFHLGAYLGGFEVIGKSLEGFEIEIANRFLLAAPEERNKNFEGFYIAPLFQFSSLKYSATILHIFSSGNNEEKIYASASGFALGFDTGYQIVWNNFTLNLNSGLQVNLSPKELRTTASSGNTYHVETINTFEWRGLGVGIGILF